MIPEYPRFKPIESKDFDKLQAQLSTEKRNICELAAANLLIWKDFDRPETTLINNNLCIRINPLNDEPFFLEPLSHNKLDETIKTCLGSAKNISRVSEDFIRLIPGNNYNITCLRSQFDYVYKIKELAELKGKKFDAKRNHIKRFIKQFPGYEFSPLSFKHKNDIFALFDKWFNIRKESRYFPRLAYNAQKGALEYTCRHFNDLGLIGGEILACNKLIGFVIGSKLNTSTISAHFQYCDPEIQGAPQTILWEACNKLFNGYEFINLEQDLGIPGLRQAKLSYHPYKIEKKFEISLKP